MFTAFVCADENQNIPLRILLRLSLVLFGGFIPHLIRKMKATMVEYSWALVVDDWWTHCQHDEVPAL